MQGQPVILVIIHFILHFGSVIVSLSECMNSSINIHLGRREMLGDRNRERLRGETIRRRENWNYTGLFFAICCYTQLQVKLRRKIRTKRGTIKLVTNAIKGHTLFTCLRGGKFVVCKECSHVSIYLFMVHN